MGSMDGDLCLIIQKSEEAGKEGDFPRDYPYLGTWFKEEQFAARVGKGSLHCLTLSQKTQIISVLKGIRLVAQTL